MDHEPAVHIPLGEMLNKLNANESGTGRIRFPYQVGILGRGVLADTVAYGRSLGLDVQVHVGGGFLVQRGFIVASGKGSALYLLLERLAVVFEWVNND